MWVWFGSGIAFNSYKYNKYPLQTTQAICINLVSNYLKTKDIILTYNT